jgi:OOP family OmpA-OmpF porin
VVAPAAAAAAPAPAVAPAKIPEVVPAPRVITFRADAFFDFDKSAVKPEGQAALKSMIEQAKGTTIEQVRVEGHTDATGPAKYNIGLSVRRAEAVKKFLVQEGIPANKVVTEGVGEAQPVATNNTRDGRALNRRVEVEFVGSRIAK